MNIKNKLITLVFLTFLASCPGLKAQAIPQEVVTSFSQGNASNLAGYFNSSIELIILEEENVYSKAQAQQILKSFFQNNPPGNFTIIHNGGKDSSRYAIGTLSTSSKTYRVTIFLSKDSLIHQLRIEYNNDV